MKTVFVILGTLFLTACQIEPGILGNIDPRTGQSPNLDPTLVEITQGLKEALNQGAKLAGERASSIDGFLANNAIKILLPPEVKQIEGFARNIGLGSYLDQLVIQMNRSAEEASKKAGPIFLSAIMTMTFGDVMSILQGNDSAATDYLRQKTSLALQSEFAPIVKSAMDQYQVASTWKLFAESYNQIPLVTKVTTDLPGHVTAKALDGLFYYLAEEEKKIRKDPVARTSEILQKVFSYADRLLSK